MRARESRGIGGFEGTPDATLSGAGPRPVCSAVTGFHGPQSSRCRAIFGEESVDVTRVRTQIDRALVAG